MTDKNARIVKLGDNDWRNMLITEMKRTGGDPSFLFEILEDVVKERAWEILLDTNGNPVGSLRRLIEAPPPVGCGQKAEKVLRLLEIEHRYERDKKTWHRRMETLRTSIRKELGESIPPLQSPSNTGRGKTSDISEVSKVGGTSRSYRIALLKRDAPDIAEKVVNDEISAAEGMRQLHKRQGKIEERRRAVNLNDAESSYKTLINLMPVDVLEELTLLLIDRREENS